MMLDEVFILRCWLEQVDTGTELRWRAQVRSVGTHESRVAKSVDAAFTLIASRLRTVQSQEQAEAGMNDVDAKR
jgi:hypothetical protein